MDVSGKGIPQEREMITIAIEDAEECDTIAANAYQRIAIKNPHENSNEMQTKKILNFQLKGAIPSR